jgi:tripartite-type tricarboxylate transporter receptor subunit TctC
MAKLKLPRRRFLHLAAGAAAMSAMPRIAKAQAYPSRPVRCLVGYAPGGGTDILVRLVGQSFSSRLGQPLIIENRPGAATNIATEMVVRAPADGYTLLGTDTAAAINATLYSNLSFNFLRDIALIGLTKGPLVLTVHPSVPARTVPEFIAYVKANPGKIAIASAGNGTGPHLAGELFKATTGIEMTHVPYRGAGPALPDLLGGQVQAMFIGIPVSGEHIRTGRLRALAVTTSTRWPTLPDVPPLSDFVPGYDASQWWAIGLRKGTPDAITEKLHKETTAILSDPNTQARLADLGSTIFAGSLADFDKFVAADTEKWSKVIREANIRPE